MMSTAMFERPMFHRWRAFYPVERVFAGALLLVGCGGSPYAAGGDDRSAARSESALVAKANPVGHAKAEAPPEFILGADDGDMAAGIAGAVDQAAKDRRQLVVYIGAEWCEPCKQFHRALEAGELDDALAGVRFLEFDADRHGKRLDDAGYVGRYIPRFALPAPDGTFSGDKVEGGIKGDGAVAHIMKRLGPLLE